jgi:hypothetical protein
MFCTLALLGLQNGTGKRRYLIPDEKLPNGMKVCYTVSAITFVFANLSVLVVVVMRTYLRCHEYLPQTQHWYLLA